jgi:hypothetical protein
LVEKWIPPSRLETAEIGQKTEGILGVKLTYWFGHYIGMIFEEAKCRSVVVNKI